MDAKDIETKAKELVDKMGYDAAITHCDQVISKAIRLDYPKYFKEAWKQIRAKVSELTLNN